MSMAPSKARAERLRRERRAKAILERAAAACAYRCEESGCAASYPTPNGLGQHLRRVHGILGMRHREADIQAAVDRARSFAVRGGNIDSERLWAIIGANLFGSKRGAA
jgi:hypothetical protein